MRKNACTFILTLVVLLTSCQTTEPGYSPEEIAGYSYNVPIQIGDGWETAGPEPEHISVAGLNDGVRAIMRGEYPGIHSILVACQGKLIFEEYFPGYPFRGEWTDFDHATPHALQSATKSLTALVFGIAVDQGDIENIDSTVLTWYPEYDRPDRAEKETVTLRHLLAMQSGLEWNEWSRSLNSRFNDLNRFYRSRDPIDYLLRRELADVPGTVFSYNTGSINLLGDLIYRSTGQYFDEYAEQYFFKPLGITNTWWERGHGGIVVTGGGLQLRPRDLLKVGQLILQNGMWEDTQIVSEDWLKQTFYRSVYIDFDTDFGFHTDYGFQWWLPRISHPGTREVLEPYVAAGWGGQYLIIYPEQELIIVMTGGNYETEDVAPAWHDAYFLPAIMLESQ